MRRISCFLIAAFVMGAVGLFLTPVSAVAITYGFSDSTNAYPNVGAFIVQSQAGQIFPICSGTLITPNVFLTASHCTAFYEAVLASRGFTAFVSFDNPIPFGSQTTGTTNLVPVATVVTNPDFNQSQSDSGDIAVLILQNSVGGITPATLPSCGLLDQLSAKNGLKGAVFTAVGYGVQNRVVGGGVPFFQDLNPIPRMFAFSSFDALNKGYIRLSQNPATGDGGTCFGDSGGPNFLTVDGQQILAAITITGDSVCRATNVDYRVDIGSAQEFFAYVNSTFGTAIPTSSCPS
jgi:Trypsin